MAEGYGMRDDYKTWYEQVMEGLLKLKKAMSESYGLDDDVFKRFKNCVNCDHSEVCVVVARRKAQKANDYTPCSKWKLVEK